MTRFLSLLIVMCLVLASAPGAWDSQDEIKKRQAELQSIRDQIKEFEQQILEHQQSEKATLELLDTYDRKGMLVSTLIRRLQGDVAVLGKRIAGARLALGRLEHQLDFLKSQYARFASAAYRAGRAYDLELLVSSASINQFQIRSEYLRRFTAQRKSDARNITLKQNQMEEARAQLEAQLGEERELLAEKQQEENRLTSMAADRRDALSQIRKDRNLVQREIDRQIKAARQIEGMIANLIEEDRIRKEREAEAARKSKLPQPPVQVGTFALRKGKLRWPVSEGRVVAHFGNQTHPTLKTITTNTGIDIAVKPGTPVSAVAEGEVSRIWWLPSYGNLLIVNHYNGYRTIYTHLADIAVIEGQKLKEGDALGTSGESVDGARLHFELWKDKDKQNPEQWLGKP